MNANNNTMNESMQQMEKATQSLIKAYEEMSTIAHDQVDATMRSASAYWQGATEINQNMNGLVHESVSRAVNAGKTLMGARTMREMMDLQGEFMKDFFDCWVSGTGKISEISARATKQAVDPLAEHANNAIGKIAQRVKTAA